MAALPPTDPMNKMADNARHLANQTDDIGRLKSILQLPHLNYIDISARNALEQALQRWPLLAETSSRNHAAPAAAPTPETVA